MDILLTVFGTARATVHDAIAFTRYCVGHTMYQAKNIKKDGLPTLADDGGLIVGVGVGAAWFGLVGRKS